MAPESSFLDFGDPFINAVAADWYLVSIFSIRLSILVLRMQASYLPWLLALQSDPLSRGIFRLPLPLQVSPFPANEFDAFFPEIPPETPPALGIERDILHSEQIPHEAPILQPQVAAIPPYSVSDRALSSSFHSPESVWVRSFPRDLLESRTTPFTTISLMGIKSSTLPTISKMLSILSANPNLQCLMLFHGSVPHTDTDKSPLQIQLRHLKELHLTSTIRRVLG
jgi:hypothetical protein